MRFGVYLVHRGLIGPEEFVEIVDQQLRDQPLFGALAMKSGKLSVRQVFEVLRSQADSSEPFGEVAKRLGYLNDVDIAELLRLQVTKCRTLSEILVDSGILDEATVDAELQQFRLESAVLSGDRVAPEDFESHDQQAGASEGLNKEGERDAKCVTK